MRLFLSAVILAGTASASFPNQIETCSVASDIARSIMSARQDGMAATDLSKAVLPSIPEQSVGLVTDMITTAYSKPRFNGAEYQANAVGDFADDIFVSCMGS